VEQTRAADASVVVFIVVPLLAGSLLRSGLVRKHGRASLRSDGVRVHPGIPFGFPPE
jgi:ACR3 family arsenite efflux pump ArsB